MLKAKVTAVGNSVVVELPKEVSTHLRVSAGDTLCITETPTGIELSPYDADLEADVTAAREVMRRYRNALRDLAK